MTIEAEVRAVSAAWDEALTGNDASPHRDLHDRRLGRMSARPARRPRPTSSARSRRADWCTTAWRSLVLIVSCLPVTPSWLRRAR